MSTPGDERRQPSTLATALRRLTWARMRERWLRRALWLWCAVLLVWLLPIGPWSAPRLAPLPTVIVGALLVAAGSVLVLLHQRASRADAVRTAMDAAVHASGPPPTT